MQLRLLEWLRCPSCQSRFSLALPGAPADRGEDATTGLLECSEGHVFPIVGGIPRLFQRALAEYGAPAAFSSTAHTPTAAQGEPAETHRTREGFSREWAYQEPGGRIWYQEIGPRVHSTFLQALRIPVEELQEKVVLDVGCGNGSQAVAYSEYAGEVIAIDLSAGVEHGHALREQWAGARPERVHFVQGDLQRMPLAPRSVDVVYCAGVLHHTPDTLASFRSLVPLLRPGGTLYVWVYRYEPLVTPILSALRAATTRIPIALLDRLARLMAVPFIWFTMALNALRLRSYPRINKAEAAVAIMDIFGPPYAHHHSPDEVIGWFRAHGFEEVWSCNHSRRGFGVCGRLRGT